MEMNQDVIKERIQTEPLLNNATYITLLSLVVLIVTILFWWAVSRSRQQRKSVVLAGLSDSGKTLLFVRLAYSQYRQTFTSIKENITEYPRAKDTLRLVDIPGDERLRSKFLDGYKDVAKAFVYVVDSVTIQKDIRDVAEYLYVILVDPSVQRNAIPVLILCNKQDQPLAKGSQVIKSLLEKELNLVRVTKASQLESVDPSRTNQTMFLGKVGKDFEFSHLHCRVDFAETSASTGDDDHPTDLKALEEWIEAL